MTERVSPTRAAPRLAPSGPPSPPVDPAPARREASRASWPAGGGGAQAKGSSPINVAVAWAYSAASTPHRCRRDACCGGTPTLRRARPGRGGPAGGCAGATLRRPRAARIEASTRLPRPPTRPSPRASPSTRRRSGRWGSRSRRSRARRRPSVSRPTRACRRSPRGPSTSARSRPRTRARRDRASPAEAGRPLRAAGDGLAIAPVRRRGRRGEGVRGLGRRLDGDRGDRAGPVALPGIRATWWPSTAAPATPPVDPCTRASMTRRRRRGGHGGSPGERSTRACSAS